MLTNANAGEHLAIARLVLMWCPASAGPATHRKLRDGWRGGRSAEWRLDGDAAAGGRRLFNVRPLDMLGRGQCQRGDARLQPERPGPMADRAMVRPLVVRRRRTSSHCVVGGVVGDNGRQSAVVVVVGTVDVRQCKRAQRQQQCRRHGSRVRSQPPQHTSTVRTARITVKRPPKSEGSGTWLR